MEIRRNSRSVLGLPKEALDADLKSQIRGLKIEKGQLLARIEELEYELSKKEKLSKAERKALAEKDRENKIFLDLEAQVKNLKDQIRIYQGVISSLHKEKE